MQSLTQSDSKSNSKSDWKSNFKSDFKVSFLPKPAIIACLLSCVLLVSAILSPSDAQAQSSEGSPSLVDGNQVYTYQVMERDLERLAAAYPDLVSYESLGQTRYTRDIWAVKLGRGDTTLLLNGAHHAREWMTTSVLMKMIDTYAEAYYDQASLSYYDVRSLLDQVTIWIVPMVNPDGVILSQQGTSGLSDSLSNTLVRYNGNSTNFKRWKANMDGVDLNRQYPSGWSGIRNDAAHPWYQNYKGKQAAQADEVSLMMELTARVNPEMTISYHSSGNIIFWHYRTLSQYVERDKAIAQVLGQMTGYSLVKPEKNPSGGGYKDWFIETYQRPGYTIEIGDYSGEGPLALAQFDKVWSENRLVGLYAAKTSYDLWLGKQQVQYDVESSMDLLANEVMYLYPGSKQAFISLSPQTLTVSARKGDWYQVAGDAGKGWIHPSPGTLVSVEEIAATATVAEATVLYAYPDAFADVVLASFPAMQTVPITGRWDNWLRFSVDDETYWIKNEQIESPLSF